MKKIFITLILFGFFISCKKEQLIPQSIDEKEVSISESEDFTLDGNIFQRKIKKFLQDSLSRADYENINLDKAIITRLRRGSLDILRIPFKGYNISRQFILLITNDSAQKIKGGIINMSFTNGVDIIDPLALNSISGTIKTYYLNRVEFRRFRVVDGHIKKPTATISGKVIPSITEYNVLPEVVVTSTIPSSPGGGGSFVYVPSFNFPGLTLAMGWGEGSGGGGGGGGGTTPYGYYSSLQPDDKIYDPYSNSYAGFYVDHPRIIHGENVDDLEAISTSAYLKCFSNIPDFGATCSIEIFTDLPVNGEPNTFFDWKTGSPGHSFIRLKKVNGSQTVQQIIGFYPNQGWKTMFYTPVTGKFVDNYNHEYNASMKMNLSAVQMRSVITKVESLSQAKYDINDYNCTDFALQVFNFVRPGKEISIPLYTIPGDLPYIKSRTPQGLYQKLLAMKQAGGAESINITIPNPSSNVGLSKGACN